METQQQAASAVGDPFKQIGDLLLAHAIEVVPNRELHFQRTKPWREVRRLFVLIVLFSHQLNASNALDTG